MEPTHITVWIDDCSSSPTHDVWYATLGTENTDLADIGSYNTEAEAVTAGRLEADKRGLPLVDVDGNNL